MLKVAITAAEMTAEAHSTRHGPVLACCKWARAHHVLASRTVACLRGLVLLEPSFMSRAAGGATAPAALGVLAALAEETGELDPGSRTELSPVLSGTILKLLPCLAERVSTGVAPQVAEQSAAALAAWLAIMQPASTAATAGPGVQCTRRCALPAVPAS